MNTNKNSLISVLSTIETKLDAVIVLAYFISFPLLAMLAGLVDSRIGWALDAISLLAILLIWRRKYSQRMNCFQEYMPVLYANKRLLARVMTVCRFIFKHVGVPLKVYIAHAVIAAFLAAIYRNSDSLQLVSRSGVLGGIFDAGVAAIEEFWRYAMLVCIMAALTAALKTMKVWHHKMLQNTALSLAVILSSFIFGWAHSFGYDGTWFSWSVTVLLSLTGVVYAVTLLVTRNLWLTIWVHFVIDLLYYMSSNFEWYPNMVVIIVVLYLLVWFTHAVLSTWNEQLKQKENTQKAGLR